jgi:sulfatase modifying factor 1
MTTMPTIDATVFRMGSDEFYPEEAPVREVAVAPFAIDRHPVTVREFRRFVADTGHVTLAEQPPEGFAETEPGSLVFARPARRVALDDWQAWWSWVPGACWHAPEGPASTTRGRDKHPVVHVAWADAVAYAEWAGKGLPTEAEWELAARGGLDGARFAWGDEEEPAGKVMANHWRGEFPVENRRANGYEGTSPVGAFPPNGFGLYDMTGNVWEWTADRYRPHAAADKPACCTPPSPGEVERRVMKGGSHLCAPNYCLRYRPAARQGQAIDSSTSHIGFRCVVR